MLERCALHISNINNGVTVLRPVYFQSALLDMFFLLQVFVDRRYIGFFKRHTLEMAVPDGEVGYLPINCLPFLVYVACLGGLLISHDWLSDSLT